MASLPDVRKAWRTSKYAMTDLVLPIALSVNPSLALATTSESYQLEKQIFLSQFVIQTFIHDELI